MWSDDPMGLGCDGTCMVNSYYGSFFFLFKKNSVIAFERSTILDLGLDPPIKYVGDVVKSKHITNYRLRKT